MSGAIQAQNSATSGLNAGKQDGALPTWAVVLIVIVGAVVFIRAAKP